MAKSANRSPSTKLTKTSSRHLKKAGGLVKKGVRRSVRPILKTIVMALALLLVLTSAALTFTYLTGRDSDKEITTKSSQTSAPEPVAPTVVKAPVVNPKTRAFAVVEMLDTPVKVGQTVNMTVHTNPKARCSIEVGYRPKDGSPSKLQAQDVGLKNQTADEFGVTEWDWKFSSGLPKGNWRANVTCAIKDQSAVVFGDIVLK